MFCCCSTIVGDFGDHRAQFAGQKPAHAQLFEQLAGAVVGRLGRQAADCRLSRRNDQCKRAEIGPLGPDGAVQCGVGGRAEVDGRSPFRSSPAVTIGSTAPLIFSQ